MRTRKRHQREHRPQRPTERSDPTQHAKGRTGDRPGPRKETAIRRHVTRGGGVYEGQNKFVYLKWASFLALGSEFHFALEEFLWCYLGFGGGGGPPDHPPPLPHLGWVVWRGGGSARSPPPSPIWGGGLAGGGSARSPPPLPHLGRWFGGGGGVRQITPPPSPG